MIDVKNDSLIKNDQSILILSNHFSYLDGFIFYHLNKLKWKKNFHFVINHNGIKPNPILKKIGAISVGHNGKDTLNKIHRINELLADKNNLVLYFPQNQFESSNIETPSFQNSISSRINSNNTLFCSSFIELEEKTKPSFYLYFKDLNKVKDSSEIYLKSLKEHQLFIHNKHKV